MNGIQEGDGASARSPLANEFRRGSEIVETLAITDVSSGKQCNSGSLPRIVAVDVAQQTWSKKWRQCVAGIESFHVDAEENGRTRINDRESVIANQHRRGGWAEMRQRDERAARVVKDLAWKVTAGRG